MAGFTKRVDTVNALQKALDAQSKLLEAYSRGYGCNHGHDEHCGHCEPGNDCPVDEPIECCDPCELEKQVRRNKATFLSHESHLKQFKSMHVRNAFKCEGLSELYEKLLCLKQLNTDVAAAHVTMAELCLAECLLQDAEHNRDCLLDGIEICVQDIDLPSDIENWIRLILDQCRA